MRDVVRAAWHTFSEPSPWYNASDPAALQTPGVVVRTWFGGTNMGNVTGGAGSRLFRLSDYDLRRFRLKVDDSPGPDKCWPWLALKDRNGYGRFWGQSIGAVQAHRLAFFIERRTAMPRGYVVMHRCDTPPCCNPAHLRLGTAAQNNADMRAKGRARAPKFTQEHRAKLSVASRGRRPSAAARAKMSAANRGRSHSPETRARMSAARKGIPKSPEHRAKIQAALRARSKERSCEKP